MFKITNDSSVSCGTSLISHTSLVFSEMKKTFGNPIDSDEYKVSGEWVFVSETNPKIVFTVYDWKCTSLYCNSLPSVESFRKCPSPQTFNIGGSSAARLHISDFIEFLKSQINYTINIKPFEDVVLSKSKF
jgi:hypothetical protein